MEAGNDSDIDDLDRKPAAKVFPKSSSSSQRTLKISPGCTEISLDVIYHHYYYHHIKRRK
jgi:hypothetical protein